MKTNTGTKRMLSLLLLAALVLSLCACGQIPVVSVPVSTAPEASAPQESPAAGQKAASEESAVPETEAAPAGTAASVVYFTSDISPEGLQAVYDALGWQPSGKLAVKVSTGEPPASNYLRADLIGPLVQPVLWPPHAKS